MRQAAVDAGFIAWRADGLIEDYAPYARGEAEAISPNGPGVTGQPVRRLSAFMADHK